MIEHCIATASDKNAAYLNAWKCVCSNLKWQEHLHTDYSYVKTKELEDNSEWYKYFQFQVVLIFLKVVYVQNSK